MHTAKLSFSPHIVLASALLITLSACATYDDKVAPIPLPSESNNAITVQGVSLLAQSYVDVDHAEDAFGFDIRGAGVLPIRFVVENLSDTEVEIRGDQTFLIDEQKQAWPLLTYEQAYKRINQHVEIGETIQGAAKPAVLLAATGALVGAAVGAVTGGSSAEAAGKGAAAGAAAGAVLGGANRYHEVGEDIRENLAEQNFENRGIAKGEIAHGYLFFPGDEEALSAHSLRLAIYINDQQHIVRLATPEKS